MITARSIIFSILNSVRSGKVGNSESLSERFILFLAEGARAQLIKQSLDKNSSVSDGISSQIECLSVSQVDSGTSNLETGCYLYKSNLALPKLIESKNRDMLLRVSSPEIGNIPFDLIPYERLPYCEATKFPITPVSLRGGYLYLKTNKFLKKLTVEGIFQNPSDLEAFSNCSGSPCFDWDSNYPVNLQMLPTIIEIVTKQLRGGISPQDNINDENGNLQPIVDGKRE